MRVLAIDTSTKAQSLALTRDSDVVARRLSFVKTNHSESLLKNIDDMLAQAGWKPASLDLVAVGLGPGTFTGLRVGLATAKAIALGTAADLVGVDSLAATANPVTALFSGHVVSVSDARRGEVYVGVYRRTATGLVCEQQPDAARPENVREIVEALDGDVVLVGGGLRVYPQLQDWPDGGVTVMPSPWDAPSSVSIAFLGAQRLTERGPDNLAELEPNYVRPSDAEINFGPSDHIKTVLK